MSVAAASGAVSTQHHQPTQDQIRLAQLIDDKKHDQPEVQEIVRKILDVVANSNTEDILVALFDCDYDYEKTVALLIEKGHEMASEWRTATNHKLTKKQQQKTAITKNGHGELEENGYQRGHDHSSHRGKSRGSRSRFQQNGSDSHQASNNQNQSTNDSSLSQSRSRGGGGGNSSSSAYRGRSRGQNRMGHRHNDRTHPQQLQDLNADSLTLSDTTTQRPTDGNLTHRRGRGAAAASGNSRQTTAEHWDVGNWNGETVIYSRTAKDDEHQSFNSNDQHHISSEVSNGSLNGKNAEKSKSDFDPVEAARQIKNVIGIGPVPKPLMEIKPLLTDPKSKAKPSGQMIINKVNSSASPPSTSVPGRIPQEPVIFSDRFDGGVNKIDVQFGNLGETYEEPSSNNPSIPTSSSAFYHPSESLATISKLNPNSISTENSQRTVEPSTSYISPTMRPTEQQPVINQQQQRLLTSQIQQQAPIAMKPVVTSQYQTQQTAQQQQYQMNAQSIHFPSLFYSSSQHQQEQISLENAYDPAALNLSSIDFQTTFYMPTPMNQPAQPTSQARFIVSQQPQPNQQTSSSNRQVSSNSMQTSSVQSAQSSSVQTASNVTKKAPIYPPGIFSQAVPNNHQMYSATYPNPYSLPTTVGAQQQTAGTSYSGPYDADHLMNNPFIQLPNAQQGQSPSGTFGSVTPPVQQQQQHGNNSTTDNKAITFRAPFNDNLLLLQQFNVHQANSQQQGQQNTAHSAGQLNYFLNRPPTGPNYSPGPPMMYAQTTPAMGQQAQVPKQQGHQYNQNNSSLNLSMNDDYYSRASTSNKDLSYMYTMQNQNQHIPTQSGVQQASTSKQPQVNQRTNAHNYNNQQRPYQ